MPVVTSTINIHSTGRTENAMFDPNIGRFISRDPIDFEGGDTNLYRYVANSPVNGTDPSGLQANGGITARAYERAFQRNASRRVWEVGRSSGTMGGSGVEGGARYRYRFSYSYFKDDRTDNQPMRLARRLVELSQALVRVLNDIPPVNAQGSERYRFTGWNRLRPEVQASLTRFFTRVGNRTPLTNIELSRVRNVFQQVATAIDTETPRFECTDRDERGLGAWVTWLPIRGWTVVLPPAFWANGPRRQVAMIFHELSHVYADTEDHGYIVARSWTVGVANDRPSYSHPTTERPVTLTDADLMENAHTYEFFFWNYYLNHIPE
jgi:hypothetical protein